MKKRIFKNRFLLLVILTAYLALSACNSNSKATISDAPAINEQDVGQGIEELEIDRYSEITDRSKDEDKFAIYFLHLPRIEGSKHKSGDASLLISPDGQVMLIDAGLSQSSRHIVGFLEDLGMRQNRLFCRIPSSHRSYWGFSWPS